MRIGARAESPPQDDEPVDSGPRTVRQRRSLACQDEDPGREMDFGLGELRRVNLALREALSGLEQRYGIGADCYEFAPIACCGIDARGDILDVNIAGAALFGDSKANIVGRPLEDFVVLADRSAVREHLRSCGRMRTRMTAEARLLGEQGAEPVMRIISTPFLPPSATEWIVVTVITELASSTTRWHAGA
jgi:PAS domain S-box-containing protein